MNPTDAVLALLHRHDAPWPAEDVAAWTQAWRGSGLGAQPPLQIALQGGHLADRPAWAFAAGYQAALRALWPGWGAGELAALCLTEPTGNRPRDLHSTAQPSGAPGGGWLLSGTKRWATLGPACDQLLVVARDSAATRAGEPHPRLGAWRVPTGAEGLRLQAMPPTAFVPELPHAQLELQAVAVPPEARLPGDGWADVGKPFCTLEDGLVAIALLAHLLHEAQRLHWPTAWRQRAVATLCALADASLRAPGEAGTQVLLAGALDGAHGLYAEATTLYAATPDDPAFARWARDQALVQVAGKARAQRTALAWQRLSGDPQG